MALNSYHQMNSTYPPSSTWPGASASANYASTITNAIQSVNGSYGPNWVVLVLPQLDQTALYQTFAVAPPLGNPANFIQNAAGPASTPIPVMICPTDTNTRSVYVDPNSNNWARGNYAANGGLNVLPASIPPAWQQSVNTLGVMGLDVALTLDQIKDGASNTLMLAEVRAGLAVPAGSAGDPRGVWALGGTPSSLWGHGSVATNATNAGNDNGPNFAAQGMGDQMFSCGSVQQSVPGGSVAMTNVGMPCVPGSPDMNQTQTARSMHVGGVQAAFCDGSVHFISNSIQTVNANSSGTTAGSVALSVWDMINLSNDGQVLAAGSF